MGRPAYFPRFSRAALDILHHHETYDGKGYPAGLKETEITIVSRIVSVIDALDVMVCPPVRIATGSHLKKPFAACSGQGHTI